MSRLRERNDYFEWRGDRYAFHQLVDGPVLARLDPDSEDEQTWPLHSRRVISPTGAEVRDIAKQVQGVDLPERFAGASVVRVRDDGLADRVTALEARVAELEARKPEVIEKVVEVEKIVHVEVAATVAEEPVGEPMPDVLRDTLARLVEPDAGEEIKKQALLTRWINLKAQMEDMKLPERDRKLPPLSIPEIAEFEQLEAYMSWFK